MIDSNFYLTTSEYNITQLLEHFDSNYIINVMEDRLNNISIINSNIEPNIVSSFEENFKLMKERYPGDGANINILRQRIYIQIIEILCDKFNIQFNFDDESINLYTAAYYAYDFLVCNRNNIMINFYTSFIVNNKDFLYNQLQLEDLKKNKDSSVVYNKKIYTDQKYIVISANMQKVIEYITTLDISLSNIFSSTYINPEIVMFLDNAFADKGNFFNTYYCNINIEIMPIVITNIRLQLQRTVGSISENSIENILNAGA